ncbi:peptidylprolyl isomerase [Pseudomaricurvus sp. HS19]|uniref:peptidylprolyl isomerase n=1 Tax=Pseudomaricurvus sp. HS19 TaxID=2692626 RepID=UPI0013701F9A|nr:peptidylprolyl isomerase [Pseudomaricurvus sp. HS19]MYM62661.1 peptidyl-prolyl cis-trans isomerase [Pseudomaricurvus sp. HS19]
MRTTVSILQACCRQWLLATLLLGSVFCAVTTQAEQTGVAPSRVTLETDLGTVVLQLYPDKAPATVANFLQYARDGFYDLTIFHRVIPGFVVQGGGMTYDFVRKETRDPVVNESNNGLLNRRGTVAMARMRDPDSATSQFYVNLGNNSNLNPVKKQPGYTVFGEVVEGMDVIDLISMEPTGRFRAEAPDTPVRILKVTIE